MKNRLAIASEGFWRMSQELWLKSAQGRAQTLRIFRVAFAGSELNQTPFIDSYFLKRAWAVGIEIEILRGNGEGLPLPDRSADMVISTLVLCSVSDVPGVLSEILRVLRPAGGFCSLSTSLLTVARDCERFSCWLKPLWKRLGDGSEPNRETWVHLEAAGCANLNSLRFKVLVPLVSP